MQVVKIGLDEHILALPLDSVEEVLPPLWIEPVEDARPPLRGTLNWHGELIWALDISRLFGSTPTPLTREVRIPVIRHRTQAFALVCPNVDDVCQLDALTTSHSAGERIAAVGRDGDTQVQVLNLDTLLKYLD
ncbi:MAG: chemotaxis protein CheW [Gammaproteobacteria bacterium]|nr:MAG: chemotaxis protein CheW [Gammaproteobacteria bacterium]